MILEGREAFVVGMGRSGEAAAMLLLRHGARVTCSDRKSARELGDVVDRLSEAGCAFQLGEQLEGDFRKADLVVMSPGVPLSVPAVQGALKAGVEVIGEMELACRFVKAPILAVTGSNGKTTTVSLIDHILETAGIAHWTGGNIGRPLSGFLLDEALDPDREAPKVILTEVSSFQMETIVRFRPWIAAWTNLSADHLDWYPDMESYAEAKARVFMNQTPEDLAVIPLNDTWLNDHKEAIGARVIRFGIGTDPALEIAIEDREIRIRLDPDGPGERYSLSNVRLVGRHNFENIMVALAVARLCGVHPDRTQEAIDSFEGLEHRLEYVAEAGGVRFYNDSKATTVASVICALEAFDRPVVLLAGGKDKGGSYAALREPIREHARQVILFGAASGRMRAELDGSSRIETVKDLESAVRCAGRVALPGDVVLLSPACSSFDQFRDYEDRGEQFKALVRRIAQEKR